MLRRAQLHTTLGDMPWTVGVGILKTCLLNSDHFSGFQIWEYVLYKNFNFIRGQTTYPLQLFGSSCEKIYIYLVVHKRPQGAWTAHLIQFLPFEGNDSNKGLSDSFDSRRLRQDLSLDHFFNWKFLSVNYCFQDIGWKLL